MRAKISSLVTAPANYAGSAAHGETVDTPKGKPIISRTQGNNLSQGKVAATGAI
jgi:hypothetical protein